MSTRIRDIMDPDALRSFYGSDEYRRAMDAQVLPPLLRPAPAHPSASVSPQRVEIRGTMDVQAIFDPEYLPRDPDAVAGAIVEAFSVDEEGRPRQAPWIPAVTFRVNVESLRHAQSDAAGDRQTLSVGPQQGGLWVAPDGTSWLLRSDGSLAPLADHIPPPSQHAEITPARIPSRETGIGAEILTQIAADLKAEVITNTRQEIEDAINTRFSRLEANIQHWLSQSGGDHSAAPEPNGAGDPGSPGGDSEAGPRGRTSQKRPFDVESAERKRRRTDHGAEPLGAVPETPGDVSPE